MIPVSAGQYLSARALVQVFTKPASSASISMILRYWKADGTGLGQAFDSTPSATSGTNIASNTSYELAINGDVVPAGAAYAQIIIFSTITGFNETWDYRFGGITVSPTLTAPKVFDGSMPGFVFLGKANKSFSYGPIDQVNQVKDPFARDGTYWEHTSTAGATLNQTPDPRTEWQSDLPGSGITSMYFKITNPDTTARNLGVRSKGTNQSDRFVVKPGRTYKGIVDVNVLQRPASGVVVQIGWVDSTGASVGVWPSTTIPNVGVNKAVTVSGIAPSGATHAYLRIMSNSTSVSGAVFEAYFTLPSFLDVTEFDGGRFPIMDTRTVGSGGDGMFHRKIPRPFLIRRVRKASSIPAPERQDGYKYKRDFTAALRAADPRVYTLDKRREELSLAGLPNYVSLKPPDVPAANLGLSVNTRPPTGFTQEEYTAIPNGSSYTWMAPVGRGSTSYDLGYAVLESNGANTGPWGVSRYRYYRSSEGYTYAQPRVVMKGTPNGPYGYPWRSTQATSGAYAYNYIGAVLKRTATASIELRFNGDGNMQTQNSPDPAQDLEIWIKLSAGSMAKVAGYDMPYGGTVYHYSGFVSNGVITSTQIPDDAHVVGYIDANNIITFELWSSYPGPGSIMIGQVQHQMTAGQIAELGIGVSGQVGVVHGAASVSPYSSGPTIYMFEARRNDIAPVSKQIMVIGNIDVPYEMELRGDVVNPVITIGNSDGPFVSRFTDTFQEANPVLLDSRFGTVQEVQSGISRFGGLQGGSSLGYLKPGLNTVQIDSLNWGVGPHALMRWRDARR
jgi:hypothetical protein